MFDTAIGLTALVFLVVLIRYVIQLTDNNKRLFAITRRGYELELELTRAQVHQAMDQTKRDVRETETMWKGFRRFQVIFKVKEAKDIVSFYLVPMDGRPLPSFLPGQFLTFKLNIPGQKKPVIRCYSLSDSPNHPDYYRVTVKRQSPPPSAPDAPPGLSSSYFHDILNEREVIDVKAPSGQFHLDPSNDSPVVLIGCGVGITPLLSMLNSITEKDSSNKLSNRETWLFLGCHNRVDHLMKEHIETITSAHKNVSLHVCYSSPRASDILGKDYQHKGRVTMELLQQVLPSKNYKYYFCGPPKMLEDFNQGLNAWGVPEKNIQYEAFNSAAINKLTGTESTETESSIKVTFAQSQMTLPWNPSAGSLLAFAEENGIMLDFGCRVGKCGSCATSIERGLVNYLVESAKKPDGRSCLTCISVPKTDLTLNG